MNNKKREALRLTAQENTLINLGFTAEEANKLRRINSTLRRWYELECGTDAGSVERDEQTGKTYWRNAKTGKLSPFRDLETGANKRLIEIITARNSRQPIRVDYYLQTDPRGAALYILRDQDVPQNKSAAEYYSRGLCIY